MKFSHTLLKRAIGSRIGKLLFAGMFGMMVGTAAQAQTDTFNVTATVGDACSVAASDLGFGTYDPLSATDTDATTTMDVTCTTSTAYEVGLDAGTGTGATTTTRILESGANQLNYILSQNSGHTTNWGNNAGVDTVAGTGTGSAQTITVYGRIAALQNVPAGSYSDVITVTVTF